MLLSALSLLLSSSLLGRIAAAGGLGSLAEGSQAVLRGDASSQLPSSLYAADVEAIRTALEAHPDDPVEVMISLYPQMADALATPRRLHVMGEREALWMTEGDKMRLRRAGKKFVDITEHEDFYAAQQEHVGSMAGKARELPCLRKQCVQKRACGY